MLENSKLNWLPLFSENNIPPYVSPEKKSKSPSSSISINVGVKSFPIKLPKKALSIIFSVESYLKKAKSEIKKYEQ